MRLCYSTLVVDDYDAALTFFVDVLGFDLERQDGERRDGETGHGSSSRVRGVARLRRPVEW